MILNNNKYVLIKQEEIKDIECSAYLLEHIKTKAQIVILENKDQNKAFTIGFKTPVNDSTGVCHIIEHTVLAGSKKYPVKEPFLELMKSSLNTFLNAMTYPDRTIYPVSSCNMQDFKNLMDIYLDAVFNPSIYQKEEIFMQEGWHYELENENAPITINGIVYNEMKGAYSTPEDYLFRLTNSAIFKDTEYNNESGGDPKDIPNLTYKNFLDYHQSHYNPTNSVIVLYGDMDYNERLEYLDKEYLGKYDYISNNFKITEQTPYKELYKVEGKYQLPKGVENKNKTYFSYAFGMPHNLTEEELSALTIINTALFEVNGAPVKEVILNKGLGSVVSSYFDRELYQPNLAIVLEEANEDQDEEFRNTIDEEIKKIIKNKLDRKTLESIISKAEFAFKEKNFGKVSKGIYHALTIISNVFYNQNPFAGLSRDAIFKFLREKLDTNYYEEILEKYILNNKHKAFVKLIPSLTKNDEDDLALKNKLAQYKASLTEKEIKELVEKTKHIISYLQKEDTKEELETIPQLKTSDVDLSVDDIRNEEETIDNTLVLKHNYETNGIVYIDFNFKLDNLTEDNYKTLGLFGNFLFMLSTKNMKYEELSKEIDIHIGRLGQGVTVYQKTDETYLSFRFSVLKEEVSNALNIVKDVFLNTEFDDLKQIKKLMQNRISELESNFNYSGNVVARTYALAKFNKNAYIQDLMTGVRHYDFLKELVNDENKLNNELNVNLVKMLKTIFTIDNFTIDLTCNDETYREVLQLVLKFKEVLTTNKYDGSFTFKKDSQSTFFKTPFNVNYCALAFDAEKPLNGTRLVASKILNTDYLWKKIRVLGGAYGAGISLNEYGLIQMASYRDPKLDQTLNVYKDIPTYLEELTLTQDDINRYIIGTIGDNYYPKSVSSLASFSHLCYKLGKNQEDLVKEKQEILNTSLKDIKAYIDIFKEKLQNASITIIGNEESLKHAEYHFDDEQDLLK